MCLHQPFVNLHVHTAYSLRDSISQPKDIATKVKELKQPAIAITEHGNVYSSVKMHKYCKEMGIKHIYGLEAYVADNRFEKNKDRRYYHMTILAQNEAGRMNINKLVSLSYEGYYYKPRIDFELLKELGEGLIILSGCMASELQQTLAGGKIGDKDIIIRAENYTKAKAVAMRYKQAFGDNYYLEVQAHRDSRQQRLNRAIVNIATDLDIKWVATSDSHFVNKEDQELHGIWVQLSEFREAGEIYNDCQIQSIDEAREFLKPALTDEEIELAISSTMEIMERCNVKIPLSAPIIPHIEIPKEFSSEDEYVKHLCRIGWKKRGIHKLPKDQQKKYLTRLQYEFDAIFRMGFSGYYLLVESYANAVERRGIARGSGGGSLVAYLMNIVNIDPVRFDLWFERFIDISSLDLLDSGQITKEELKIPDFDLDFGVNEREQIVQKLVADFGQDHVANLGLFTYAKDKLVVTDVGRILGIPIETVKAITKIIGEEVGDEAGEQLQNALDGSALKLFIERKPDKRYEKLFDYSQQLLGLPRSFGSHPCGKIVSINPVNYYTAMDMSGDEAVIHLDMKDAELLGLVKIDALGLRTIDVQFDTLEMIGQTYDYIEPTTLDYSDEKVLEIFRKGWTHGIFQFESNGMQETLKKMVPTGLEDLGAVNALYRPGAMKYIDSYINRKHGRENFVYLNEELKDIISDTYGIMVFQEQLISIGKLANMRNPDLLRKATGKKDINLLNKAKPELYEGLSKNGWTEEQINQLLDDMIAFAKYSFNKAHSYAYAIIAFQCAKLKAYHPTEFMCALFNSFRDNKVKQLKGGRKENRMETCYNESKRMNVEFNRFSFNNPSTYCTVVDGKINYGVALVKYCNVKIAEQLQELSNNEYKNFVELLIDIRENTSLDVRQLKILTTLDFFHEFGGNKQLLDFIEKFEKRYKVSHKDKTKIVRIAELKAEWKKSKEEILDYAEQVFKEKDFLGFGFYKMECNKNMVLVTGIDKKYAPKISLYKLATGIEVSVKVKRKDFFDKYDNDRLMVGDVVKVQGVYLEDKKRKEGERYISTGEKDVYLKNCIMIRRTVVPEITPDEKDNKVIVDK